MTTTDENRRDLHLEYFRTRDPEVRGRLVADYEGLARRLAARFSKRADDLEDLVQVALLGLLKALDRYDPTRGVQFTTFAWATVEGELKRHLRDRSWGVRVPRRLQESYLRTSAAVEELTHELGRAPTVGELADHTGLHEEDLIQALEVRSASTISSLDAPVRDDNQRLDLVGGDDIQMERMEELALLQGLLDRLPARERRILQLRFGDELKQSEIGAELGLSQMQISRILGRVLNQLRSWADEESGDTILADRS